MADWSTLPKGSIKLIARFFRTFDDFMAFRGTCASWRSATSFKDFKGGREFFIHLYKKSIIRISMPEIKVEYRTIASKGWLIMLESEGNVSLLNPITRVHIQLPPIYYDDHEVDDRLRINYRYYYLLESAVLSASPSETSEYAVMVSYYYREGDSDYHIGFWRSGDQTWKKARNVLLTFKDLTYHNGNFYGLSKQHVWMCDVGNTSGSVQGDAILNAIKIINLPSVLCLDEKYFVRCGDKLLVLFCPYEKNPDGNYFHRGVNIIHLNVEKAILAFGNNAVLSGRDQAIDFHGDTGYFQAIHGDTGYFQAIFGLGNNAVFLGRNEAISLDATRYPGVIKPNRMYFSNGRCIHAGVPHYYTPEAKYNIEDVILNLDSDNNVISSSDLSGSSNVWVTPSI